MKTYAFKISNVRISLGATFSQRVGERERERARESERERERARERERETEREREREKVVSHLKEKL